MFFVFDQILCGFEKGVSLNEFFLAHDLISFECGWLDFYSENQGALCQSQCRGFVPTVCGIGSVVVVNGEV